MADATEMDFSSSVVAQEPISREISTGVVDHRTTSAAVPGSIYALQLFLTSIPLWCADTLALLLLGTLVEAAAVFLFHTSTEPWKLLPQVSLAMLLAQCVFGLYPAIGMNFITEIRRSVLSLTVVLGTMLAASLATASPELTRAAALVVMYLGMLFLVPSLRQLARGVAARWNWWGQRAIVLGGGPNGAAAFQALLAHPGYGLRPVGILDDDLSEQWQEESAVKPEWYLGPISDAAEICARHRAVWGVLAVSPQEGDAARVVDHFASIVTHLLVLPNFERIGRKWDGVHDCGELKFVRIDAQLLLPGAQLLKRAFDLLFTLAGGLVILPVVACLVALVKITSPGPVFYSQERVGRNGRNFRAWKIRTMVVDAERVLEDCLNRDPALKAEYAKYCKLKNDPRVTRIGKFLRATSLDEIAQLWNVIRGQMSLIGPRPIMPHELSKYADMQDDLALYLRVVPGITGLWQVSGRATTTFLRRIEFDSQYVRNWSPWLDAYIFVKTIRVVLLREGAF